MIKEHGPDSNRRIRYQQSFPVKLSLFIAVAFACLLLSPLPASAGPVAQNIVGINWPDNRDNYSNDLLVPIGLDRTDSREVILAKTERIVFQAHALLGANTFRMPVNYLMTKNNAEAVAWWGKYCAAIDKITAMGHKVIICPWHVRQYADDGTTLTAYVNIPFAPNSETHIADTQQMIKAISYFWDLWAVVIARYRSNPNVYFEVWNEPGRCTKEEWVDICVEWLRRYPATSVPRDRVIIAGTGWSWNVGDVAYNPAFSECLLGFHAYSTQRDYTNKADWTEQFNRCMNVDPVNYPNTAKGVLSRVVVTEYGSTGKGTDHDYSVDKSGIPEVVFMRAISEYMTKHKMGGTAWGILHKPFQVWGFANHSKTPYLYVHNTTYNSIFMEGFGMDNFEGTFKIRNKRAPERYLYRNVDDITTAPDWGQKWVITPTEGGFYRIHAAYSKPLSYLCATLDAFPGSNNLSLAAREAVYNPTSGLYIPPADSLWKIVPQRNGGVKLWNKLRGHYCLHYTTVPVAGSNFQYQVNNEYTANGIGDYASWDLIK